MVSSDYYNLVSDPAVRPHILKRKKVNNTGGVEGLGDTPHEV